MLTVSDDLKFIKPKIKGIIEESEHLIGQIDLVVYCCTLESKVEIRDQLKSEASALTEQELKRLQDLIKNTKTSLSWGSTRKEFIVLVFDEPKAAKDLKTRALKGLFLHELLHSIQRQRGLEEDLKRSMEFSMDLFLDLADMMNIEDLKKEKIVTFLKKLSKIAILTLKDLYVNTELIKRGYVDELLDYENYLYGLLESEKQEKTQVPVFNIPYQTGVFDDKGLKELESALVYSLSILPSYLPFSKLNKLENERIYNKAKTLRNNLIEDYLTPSSSLNQNIVFQQLAVLEDLYLTTFAFNSDFHRKWYGYIFNIVLEIILGETFTFYHTVKTIEILESLFPEQETTYKDIISPLLKASYWLYIEKEEGGIQKENINALKELIDEILEEEELEEFKDLISSDEDFEVVLLYEMTFFHIVVNLRQELLDGKSENMRLYCRALLNLTHILQSKKSEEYDNLRPELYQLLSFKYRVFYRIMQVGKIELLGKKQFFSKKHCMTMKDFEEICFNLRFLEVVWISNNVYNLVVKYSDVILPVMKKHDELNSKSVDLIALLCSVMFTKTLDQFDIIEEKNKGKETMKKQAVPILRATLLGLGFTFESVRRIIDVFSGIIFDYEKTHEEQDIDAEVELTDKGES